MNLELAQQAPDGGYKKGEIGKTEIDVRKEENVIRKEQKVKERSEPQ